MQTSFSVETRVIDSFGHPVNVKVRVEGYHSSDNGDPRVNLSCKFDGGQYEITSDDDTVKFEVCGGETESFPRLLRLMADLVEEGLKKAGRQSSALRICDHYG